MTCARTLDTSAASRIALLICALATALLHSISRSSPPLDGHGKTAMRWQLDGRAHRPERHAPHARMGRRLRLASPTNVARIGVAASTPAMSRVVVPLLPQSRSVVGWTSPWRPHPRTTNDDESSGIATPSARSTPAVDCTSADCRIPVTADVALGERAEDQRAMRDGFVARDAQRSG